MNYKFKNNEIEGYSITMDIALMRFISSNTIKPASAMDIYLWLILYQIKTIESTTLFSYMPFNLQYTDISKTWKCPYMSARHFLKRLEVLGAITLERNGHRISIRVLNITCSKHEILIPEIFSAPIKK